MKIETVITIPGEPQSQKRPRLPEQVVEARKKGK
jgi:hypothetical protein